MTGNLVAKEYVACANPSIPAVLVLVEIRRRRETSLDTTYRAWSNPLES